MEEVRRTEIGPSATSRKLTDFEQKIKYPTPLRNFFALQSEIKAHAGGHNGIAIQNPCKNHRMVTKILK
jgi:hypothetical protein